ncbi:WbuC family cupin fold metalloprotein [Rhodohalobacter sp. 8-1]|uniref:WbuC family cupin fold metalloprotein n=1 Tax=Rhodohalobacter sp. 8-1 TaxID=3131972 RepID=UPI0030ED350B
MILPIHRQQAADVQRLINFLQPGTYVRPHKHPMPHATESIILLQGAIRFFTFDGAGDVITDQTLTSSSIPDVIDIEPGTWHSFLVLESDTIIFECKKGPYNAETDKKFAAWAPDENEENVANFIENLAR